MKINLTRQLYIFLDVDGVLNNYNHYTLPQIECFVKEEIF